MALFQQCLEIESQRLFCSRTLVNKRFFMIGLKECEKGMKLALIATEKLPVPPIRGGAIQIFLDSVAPIIGEKHEVTVISIQDSQLRETEQKNGIRFIRFPEKSYVPSIAKHLEEENYDVVHVCNRPTSIQSFKTSAPHSKFILSVHNEMFSPRKITDEEGRACIATVSRIITVSEYIKNTITNRFPEGNGKTHPLYSGVDLSTFHPIWTEVGNEIRNKTRRALGLEGKKIILFVGRLSKVKGTHILLQALPEVVRENPEAVFVIVGSKWFGDDDVNKYVKHLYTLAAMYKEHVMFTKFIPPKHIPDLYIMSDLLVCPSQWQEPLARVHYEAMAAGLPLITSNRGGNPEVIEEGRNGFVIHDYENPKAYAAIINDLLENPSKREQLGKYGRAKVEEEYGWKTVALNLQRVYEEVFRNG
jgi:spore coat protein SA